MTPKEICFLGSAYDVNRPQNRLRTRFEELGMSVKLTAAACATDDTVRQANLVVAFNDVDVRAALSQGIPTILWGKRGQENSGETYERMLSAILLALAN